MSTTKTLTAIAFAGALLGTAAPPAHATPYEHFRSAFQGSFVVDGFCGDMDVRIDVDFDFLVVARGTGRDQLVRYTVSNHGAETFTNLASGKSVTSAFDYIEHDLRVTDNGDGTLTIMFQIPGAARYSGPDGRLLLVDSRPQRWEVLLDHGGTPSDPSDDTFIFEVLIRDVAAHVNKDFCAAFRTATG